MRGKGLAPSAEPALHTPRTALPAGTAELQGFVSADLKAAGASMLLPGEVQSQVTPWPPRSRWCPWYGTDLH